ncbi:MAG: MarR family EPS-associated transcriptional regulator [Flammeovirgaceae bacterium]|nr:MAG: MarR family EPS-associated transcriptional regulator [Flammeovirgaceae bacterium]
MILKKISQRELSQPLKNISLGKVNYILKALINKGIIKARNFTNSKNKRAYAYYLTSKGLQEKARLTVSFFDRKSKEYDKLKAELRELEKEIKVRAVG